MRLVLLTLIAITISGCSLFNPLIGYERSFKWHLDNYVGKPASALESEIQSGHWHPIETIQLNEQYNEQSYLLKYSPYHGPVECIWAAKVNRETNIIESWFYKSSPTVCDWPYFYEGAW